VTTLESYLTGEILRDRSDITAIENVLRETASTIAATFKSTHWPYEIIRGTAPKMGGLSQSTTAMMIHAIDLVLGVAGVNPQEPSYAFRLDKPLEEKLPSIRKSAFEALSAAIVQPGEVVETESRTYGRNDPLTLSFLAEIFLAASDRSEPILAFLRTEALRLQAVEPSRDVKKLFDYEQTQTPAAVGGKKRIEFEVSTPLSNAFIPLRILRTCYLTVRTFNQIIKTTCAISKALYTTSCRLYPFVTADLTPPS
jgi:hypothetical protein